MIRKHRVKWMFYQNMCATITFMNLTAMLEYHKAQKNVVTQDQI